MNALGRDSGSHELQCFQLLQHPQAFESRVGELRAGQVERGQVRQRFQKLDHAIRERRPGEAFGIKQFQVCLTGQRLQVQHHLTCRVDRHSVIDQLPRIRLRCGMDRR